MHARTHTHPFNGFFQDYPGEPVPAKVKPIWILLKQETVSGSGISWAICKSAHHSRQITMPAPHHSVFKGRMPFLPPNQQRQSTECTYAQRDWQIRNTMTLALSTGSAGAQRRLTLSTNSKHFKTTVDKLDWFIYFATTAVAADPRHVTASLSASSGRFSPPSNFVNGHVSTMLFVVCCWPQSQEGDWARPHLCMLAWHGPWPVRKQFIRIPCNTTGLGWLGSRVVSVQDSGAEGSCSNRSCDVVG